MLRIFVQLLHLVTITSIFYTGFGLYVKVDPEVINELITDEVNITCLVTDSPYWIKAVYNIQLGREGQHPLAILRQATLRDETNDMKIDGHNDKNASNSYLRITIKNPGVKDAGVYFCKMYYEDGFGELKVEQAYANVTVDNNDDKAVIVYLLNKMKDLGNKVDILENKVKEQSKQLKEQDEKASFQSAFSAGYLGSNKIVEGQTLLFSNTYINEGGDYNDTSGVYTAPRDGLYVFHLVAMTIYYDGYIEIYLAVNGKRVAWLYAEDKYTYDQSSVSTVVSLKAGDRVWPLAYSMSKGNMVYGTPYSVFTGYLLKLL